VALQQRKTPTALILSRQKLPVLEAGVEPQVERGAYVVSPEGGSSPRLILIATGSEVHTALEAKELLSEDGHDVRVVSMPSWELFDCQPHAYRDEVLPSTCGLRVAVEAGVPQGWDRYVGDSGAVIGVEGFGASAPYAVLAEKYGLTAAKVAEKARAMLAGD
jgi:transketolase